MKISKASSIAGFFLFLNFASAQEKKLDTNLIQTLTGLAGKMNAADLATAVKMAREEQTRASAASDKSGK